MTDLIQSGVNQGVHTLRFNRPDKKNALTAPMYHALAAAIASAEAAGDVGAHLFLGAPGMFCAGNDLHDFIASAPAASAASSERPAVSFLNALIRSTKPLVAAVDGPAIGIGATLLLHCDLVFGSPAATLGTPFIDLGLVPEAGSSLLLPQRTGHAIAFEMLCLGESLTAARALAAGLFNAVVPSADLEAHAMSAARRLAAKPRTALQLTRRLMRGDPRVIEERMQLEFKHFAERLQSPETREAVETFFKTRGRADKPKSKTAR